MQAKPTSRTIRAYERSKAENISIYEAAKLEGVSPAAVYAYERRREGRDICPCCRQVIRRNEPV